MGPLVYNSVAVLSQKVFRRLQKHSESMFRKQYSHFITARLSGAFGKETAFGKQLQIEEVGMPDNGRSSPNLKRGCDL